MKILLLGVGMQGKAALYDLVNSPDVSQIIAADINYDSLREYADQLQTPKLKTVKLDVRDDQAVIKEMRQVQAVIILLSQEFRENLVKLAIESGIHLIETSYSLPAYEDLGIAAKTKDLSILPECGLDPGIDLVLAGRAIREFDLVRALHVYGTGVPEPEAANNPIKYKISWTFAGVLGAYQRPVRMLKGGQVVDLSPIEMFDKSNIHMVDMEGLGLMEAYYNGDAVKFLDIFGIKDTTTDTGRYSLRWPGHAEFWTKMVGLGFLADEPVRVGGHEISPRQFVHDLLSPQLQYEENERDIAAIRVVVEGMKDGQSKRVIYQMIDRRDLDTGLMAMQRTVGFTASIGAQMILRGDIKQRGLLTPIHDIPSDIFIAELEKRGVQIQRQEKEIP
ncbi:MAG: saccharopine dehydrogenase NADP-binding domain-containing protein [Anaerolineales bacterium]|uniref:Saccharopine dehydrogenase NADP-binding domain-containing protein n=1 Tax=Candidatus Desulfolinea nitratireducens TaxID=2841698 RepID=A0A8J6NHY4_9CHLR|nr:saccharopine dehydrogenase NADP-binding domain-containing protein [Candidatus Desulfolinea nitratireducens]MBL6959973.1 saccharopine dehydrogenase NADP-binding domain-containing protein [Anaerolineales bacterium]